MKKHYTHLTQEERYQIYAYKNAGDSVWKKSHNLEKLGKYEKAALIIKPWADEYTFSR